MTVTVRGPATGSTVSGHDALYAYPTDFQHNGTLVSGAGADTGLPRVTLADGVTQRVKWVWAIPVDWAAMAVRWGAVPEAAVAGNVKWQFSYKPILLGEGNVDGAVTTVSVAALAAAGQFDWDYKIPSETAVVATPTGLFGDSPFVLCTLSRLGGDASDTYAGGVSVAVTTATRVDL